MCFPSKFGFSKPWKAIRNAAGSVWLWRKVMDGLGALEVVDVALVDVEVGVLRIR